MCGSAAFGDSSPYKVLHVAIPHCWAMTVTAMCSVYLRSLRKMLPLPSRHFISSIAFPRECCGWAFPDRGWNHIGTVCKARACVDVKLRLLVKLRCHVDTAITSKYLAIDESIFTDYFRTAYGLVNCICGVSVYPPTPMKLT